MGAGGSSDLERLHPRDREYVERLDEAEREVVVSTILRYQRPGKLRVGDRLPGLEVHRLDGEGTVRLDRLSDGRPLVLVFGSFT
ncbi:MAG TPA: hypothetical protein VNK94_11190 [Gaiellaceae bacterium]|nr:hypothetical protein [Gaiellaceae bacterium]